MIATNDQLHIHLFRLELTQADYETILVQILWKRIDRLFEQIRNHISKTWLQNDLHILSINKAITHFNGLRVVTFDLIQSDIFSALEEARKRAANDMASSVALTESYAWSSSDVLTTSASKAKSVIVLDATIQEWLLGQSLYLGRRFGQVLRAALQRKDSQAAALQELFSETSGPSRMAKAQLVTLAVTAMRSVRMQIFQRFYDLNENDLEALQSLATLDLKTSSTCWSRHGYAWSPDGSPSTSVGKTPPHKYPGPSPWHWNCRSVVFPVLKNLGNPTIMTFEQLRATQTP